MKGTKMKNQLENRINPYEAPKIIEGEREDEDYINSRFRSALNLGFIITLPFAITGAEAIYLSNLGENKGLLYTGILSEIGGLLIGMGSLYHELYDLLKDKRHEK